MENNEDFRVSLVTSSDPNQIILVNHADAVITNDDSVSVDGSIIHGGAGVDVLHGLAGNDTIYGHAGADVMYGGDGDDIIYSGGGADVMYGGAGNDTFVIDANTLGHLSSSQPLAALVDGGLGLDTIDFAGFNIDFDLGAALAADRVLGIEKVDITGNGANILHLTAAEMVHQDMDVFGNSTGYHQLMVDGNADDEVIIGTASDWSHAADNYMYENVSYDVWTNDANHTELLINHAVATVYGV